MNKKLIVGIVALFLGIIIATLVWSFYFAPKPVSTTPDTPITLPAGGSVNVTPIDQTETQSPNISTIPVSTQEGGTVDVNDFTKSALTTPDRSNPDNYRLTGDALVPSTNFDIYYIGSSKAFVITLTKEPLGQARLDMEQFMISALGIGEQQLCSLNYYVGTTRYINERYSTKNLGFSFCPGATLLPK